MATPADDPQGRARRAVAAAAVEQLEDGMTIGLGSGRAVWAVIEAIAERWPESPPLRAATASGRTEEFARDAGIGIVQLDGTFELDVAIDGADEIDPCLGLLKGGGAAMLREKIVVAAARRFVVVTEARKRVERLGETQPLPVEVVRFGWRDTRRRLLDLTPTCLQRITSERDASLSGLGEPVITEEGHHVLDCLLPPDADVAELGAAIRAVPGVVEHGLFLGMADQALLGREDGDVDILEPSRD